MTPGQSVGRVAVASGAEGQAWRDAVDRILAAWLLPGIDGAGLWEAVMANAPRVAGETAIRGVDHAMMSGGPPSAVGDPDEAELTQGRPWAGARAEAGERSGAPRE
jgi:hypothetical protein